MSSSGEGTLADKLRTNLVAAAIPASDADLERLLADGSLSRMEAYLRTLREAGDDARPDYLADLPDEGRTETRAPVGRFTDGASEQGLGPRSGDGLPDTIAGVAPLLRDGSVSAGWRAQRVPTRARRAGQVRRPRGGDGDPPRSVA
jgi:hypothetical protein